MRIEAEFEPEQFDEDDEAEDGLPFMQRHFLLSVVSPTPLAPLFEPESLRQIELDFYLVYCIIKLLFSGLD